jgi:hypothetical protein
VKIVEGKVLKAWWAGEQVASVPDIPYHRINAMLKTWGSSWVDFLVVGLTF